VCHASSFSNCTNYGDARLCHSLYVIISPQLAITDDVGPIPSSRARFLVAAAQIPQNLERRIMPGRAGHAASGMRARTTQI
jgi:hypothetical protein